MATPSKTATARKPNAAFMKPLTPAPSWPLSSARKPCRVPRSPRRSGITSKAQPAGCQQQAQHQRRRQAAPHLRQRPGHDVRTDQAGQRAPEVIDRPKGVRRTSLPVSVPGLPQQRAFGWHNPLQANSARAGPHPVRTARTAPCLPHANIRSTARRPRRTLPHPASAAHWYHQPLRNENGWHKASRCERNRGLYPESG